MSGLVSSLFDPADPASSACKNEGFSGCNLAVVRLDVYHSEDPVLFTKKVGERLKQGGVVVILGFFVDEHNSGESQRVGDCHGHGAAES
jgi:hypothetical protein